MPTIPRKPETDGSPNFDPEQYFAAWEKGVIEPPYDNDFRKFICRTFTLPPTDTWGYMAQSAEITLLQAQTYIEWGGQGGLHAWYRDEEGKEIPPPNATDIAAYTDVFRSSTNTGKALIALGANAKKGTLRAQVAAHLQAHYHPPSPALKIVVPKIKKEPVNPYFDLWCWTAQNLEWGGPVPGTSKIKISHAVLPILYHHFGCVVPSYESLAIIYQIAKGRKVIDLGSGNGYWTYVLRKFDSAGIPGGGKGKGVDVVAVDSGLSEWRTVWIGDTIQADGIEYLRKHDGGKGEVLLLVYPQVGAEFTAKVLRAYKGDTIICAGTQNANGFTAFANETIAQWIEREMPVFEKVCQIPLPSFAAKDEALFVFEKKAAAV